jgi:hypothetical protein
LPVRNFQNGLGLAITGLCRAPWESGNPFPHPIDILASKISRGEEKDFEAFEEVIAKTGHPTEEELLDSLICAVHLYRPGYDETAPGDPITNTRLLWKRLFGRDIDVRQEIIAAASR